MQHICRLLFIINPPIIYVEYKQSCPRQVEQQLDVIPRHQKLQRAGCVIKGRRPHKVNKQLYLGSGSYCSGISHHAMGWLRCQSSQLQESDRIKQLCGVQTRGEAYTSHIRVHNAPLAFHVHTHFKQILTCIHFLLMIAETARECNFISYIGQPHFQRIYCRNLPLLIQLMPLLVRRDGSAWVIVGLKLVISHFSK